MIVIQFRKHFFHYRLPEKHGLGTYTESVAVLSDGSHLTVIKIDYLPMPTHKRLFLFLQIFRIYT